MTAAPHALAGIALLVAATMCFATLDTASKWVSAATPVLMVLWFRYSFQAVLTTLLIWPRRGRAVLRTVHPRFHLLRGALLATTSLLGIVSLKHMPVSEFTSIVMIGPLIVTLVAALAFGERVPPLRWLLVAGGFAGTLVIIRPGADSFNAMLLLPLGLVACQVWFQLLTSRLARTEDPVTMHFYTGWTGALVTTVAVPFAWAPVVSWKHWMAMAVVGAAGTIGHYLFILAFARAPAAQLTPYLYCQIGFAVLGGWIVFAHAPDAWSLAGMALIASCGAAGAWLTGRENRALQRVPAGTGAR